MKNFNNEIHELNWDMTELENYLREIGFDNYEIKEVKNDYIIIENDGKIYKITEDGEIAKKG